MMGEKKEGMAYFLYDTYIIKISVYSWQPIIQFEAKIKL